MKKKVVFLLMCLMLLGAGSAFAAASPTDNSDPAASQMVASVKKFELLKEFQDELHQINSLRITRLETKTQIVQKQDQIIDLTLAAKENGNKEALKEAAAVRKQIHTVNADLDNLWSNMKDEMKAFKQAVKDRDSGQAQARINNVISIFGEINGKLTDKAGLYDQIIDILK
ncbi:hypothetical protein PASE110613_04860 [Paenibacillus sediminis]|uniref:Uncharacterized protein n=1 Tax=Paenibacillus sediminis TaxID=664909 RepID=A0ABS4H0Q1_9BACL|nr:hypothetical protein [Paenibacillus sediminis]MBP1936103.1 hypothetical protein [Paenibacillus sediminis]